MRDRIGSVRLLMQHCGAEHRFPDGAVMRCAELPRAVRGVSPRLRARMVAEMWRNPIPGARRPKDVGTTASMWCHALRGRDAGDSWVWVHAR